MLDFVFEIIYIKTIRILKKGRKEKKSFLKHLIFIDMIIDN